jgi:hypothetical protein
MLPPDEWDRVLGSVTGTIIHGTERVSSNRLMDLLGVENDPTRRREVGKRSGRSHELLVWSWCCWEDGCCWPGLRTCNARAAPNVTHA